MVPSLNAVKAYLDNLTGGGGSLGYFVIIAALVVGYMWTSSSMVSSPVAASSDKEEEKPDPPRNFTTKQLRYYDGASEGNDDKPVYLSVSGIVFDVSEGRDFYGPGGPYEKFAGRECGVALAKMSFDEEHLDDLKGCKTLSYGEKTELEGWIEKFTYFRPYPIRGRLIADESMPDPNRILTVEDLKRNDGTGEVPEGYGAAPIYIGAGDKVFDMSFGGGGFYGPGGPYMNFAGKDASRALATMSLDIKEIENSSIDDLEEKQIQVMNDWIKTFSERKCYPVVGKLQKC